MVAGMANKQNPACGKASRSGSDDIQAVAGVWQNRKRMLIGRLGRELPSYDGLHQPDQYDGEDTLYLVACEAGTGRHLGSVRLLPSTGPHVLHDRFAHLCAAGVPVGTDVWELSRLVTAPGLNRTDALHVRRQLAAALIEHALGADISRYTMIAQLRWLPGLLGIGWDAEPLGLPHGQGDTAMAALQIIVDAGTLARLRGAWELPDTAAAPLAN